MTAQNIVIPWDFSDHAKAALAFAMREYSDRTLHVVCVLEPPNPYTHGFSWGSEAYRNEELKCESEFRALMGDSPLDVLHFYPRFGEPSLEISRFVKELDDVQIVMSTHGRTGIRKILMGSIAQKVLDDVACPVLLLPAKWFDSQSSQIAASTTNANES